jgi:SAM-dependent methyltransferase
MSPHDPHSESRRIAESARTDDDPAAWFERLYQEAGQGRATVPWDQQYPSATLEEWVRAKALDGTGKTAVVVGCGLGRDAELIAGLGFATTAFDLSPTAIEAARERHHGSPVDYQVADLRDLPQAWHHAFDLVVESLTVQSLPLSLRATATRAIADLVAPGGTLIVLEYARPEGADVSGPPWPLSRSEIDAFAAEGLSATSVEDLPDADDPSVHRWRVELYRDA